MNILSSSIADEMVIGAGCPAQRAAAASTDKATPKNYCFKVGTLGEMV
jgi:hypothetical protein